LGIHFPRKTANRQWINRPNRWRDRNTCGPQRTSCILFIYPEYSQLLHLDQAKNGKMVGGLWGVVYVYKAIFIGGLPKTPIFVASGAQTWGNLKLIEIAERFIEWPFFDDEIPRNQPPKLSDFSALQQKDATSLSTFPFLKKPCPAQSTTNILNNVS